MAIDLKFTPDRGAGDRAVSVKCPKHTGRNSRTQNVIVSDGYTNCTVAVTQTGAAETAYWVSGNTTVNTSAQTITLTARTNATKSYIAFVSNAASATMIEYSYVDGQGTHATTVSQSSGAVTVQPSTDPGATAEYNVYVKLQFSATDALSSKTVVLSFSTDNVTATNITLTQTGVTMPSITEDSDAYNVGSYWYINVKNPSAQPYKLKLDTGSSSIIKVTRSNLMGDLTESLTDACTRMAERLTVKALAAGTGKVILTDTDGTQLDYYTAAVASVPDTDTPGGDEPGTDTPDEPAVDPSDGNLVDLGLPSGTLWMDRNIGASSVEDTGDRFAWAETTSKTFASSIYDTSTHLTTMPGVVMPTVETDYKTYAPALYGKSFP